MKKIFVLGTDSNGKCQIKTKNKNKKQNYKNLISSIYKI
jgi:hypothetical protein